MMKNEKLLKSNKCKIIYIVGQQFFLDKYTSIPWQTKLRIFGTSFITPRWFKWPNLSPTSWSVKSEKGFTKEIRAGNFFFFDNDSNTDKFLWTSSGWFAYHSNLVSINAHTPNKLIDSRQTFQWDISKN
jgi:hypothetical protein